MVFCLRKISRLRPVKKIGGMWQEKNVFEGGGEGAPLGGDV